MEMGLDRVRLGKWAVVRCVDTDAFFERRLTAFGLIPGTKVCCRYRSPGGGVTAVELRGAVIALRTADLKKIRVHCL